MTTIHRTVHFQAGHCTRKEMRHGEAEPRAVVGRGPRVSRLMALAIRLDQLPIESSGEFE